MAYNNQKRRVQTLIRSTDEVAGDTGIPESLVWDQEERLRSTVNTKERDGNKRLKILKLR